MSYVSLSSWDVQGHQFAHLLWGSVSEFVDDEGGLWVSGVELIDSLQVVVEDSESVVVLFSSSISNSIGFDEISEGRFVD